MFRIVPLPSLLTLVQGIMLEHGTYSEYIITPSVPSPTGLTVWGGSTSSSGSIEIKEVYTPSSIVVWCADRYR